MHMTPEEHKEAAKQSWEYAQYQLDTLGRKMDKAEKNAMRAQYGLSYALACREIETIRVQYAALVPRVTQLWNEYEKLM